MTVFAFEFFCFIEYVCCICMLYGLMAFLAGHFFMGSVKLETSPVMVKFVSRPFFKGMAQGAVGSPFFFELAVMDVLMAIGAPVAQS